MNLNHQYRRGAIMGLTVAEVFILLAFILMLLLVYWKEEEQKARDKCEEKAKACEAYVSGGARLIEKNDLIKLIEFVELLPPSQRSNFIELVVAEGKIDIVNWAEKFSDLAQKGYKPEDVVKLIEELDLDGNDMKDAIERIRKQLQAASTVGESIAGEVNRAVGDLVGSIGGTIDSTSGAVTLPDTALFDKGSFELKNQTKDFLNLFCAPWIETLSRFNDQIQALRIEGHASSEWDTITNKQEAFLKNMELSQARASAVLDYCLRRVSESHISPWAQSRMVAVGYSSAKPIIESDTENAVKSRRVVFRPETDSVRVLEEIKKEVTQ